MTFGSHMRDDNFSECCELQHLRLKCQIYKRISRRNVPSWNTWNADCSCQRPKTEGFSGLSSVTQRVMGEQDFKLQPFWAQCLGLYLQEWESQTPGVLLISFTRRDFTVLSLTLQWVGTVSFISVCLVLIQVQCVLPTAVSFSSPLMGLSGRMGFR